MREAPLAGIETTELPADNQARSVHAPKPWGSDIKRITVQNNNKRITVKRYAELLSREIPCIKLKGYRSRADHARFVTDLAKRSCSLDEFHDKFTAYFETEAAKVNKVVREFTCKQAALAKLQDWLKKREVPPVDNEVLEMSEALLNIEYTNYDKSFNNEEGEVPVQHY